MIMKRIFIAFFLLAGATLWAQNPVEKHILASKYAVDSIVAAQKAYLFKQLSSVEDLLNNRRFPRNRLSR